MDQFVINLTDGKECWGHVIVPHDIYMQIKQIFIFMNVCNSILCNIESEPECINYNIIFGEYVKNILLGDYKKTTIKCLRYTKHSTAATKATNKRYLDILSCIGKINCDDKEYVQVYDDYDDYEDVNIIKPEFVRHFKTDILKIIIAPNYNADIFDLQNIFVIRSICTNSTELNPMEIFVQKETLFNLLKYKHYVEKIDMKAYESAFWHCKECNKRYDITHKKETFFNIIYPLCSSCLIIKNDENKKDFESNYFDNIDTKNIHICPMARKVKDSNDLDNLKEAKRIFSFFTI